MATFKVGDRVRVVGVFISSIDDLIGRTGVVVGSGGINGIGMRVDYAVTLDEAPSWCTRDGWLFNADQLAPIRPLPTAQELMERANAPEWSIPMPSRVASPERVGT
jgi:hypothetical protein